MNIEWAELRVRNLEIQRQFYTRVLGLQDLGDNWLGAGSQRLVHLVHTPQAQLAPPDRPGLYHLALVLPQRSHLASWLAHVLEQGIPIDGASDHAVSEAIYLRDAEGNGLEVYWDRQPPPDVSRMTTRRLNLSDLLGQAEPYDGRAPQGTRVGHIHLQSPDLDFTSQFFADLGLSLTMEMPGARFLAADDYHHHFAINQWNVGDFRDGLYTGLLAYSIRGQLPSLQLQDPWGHQVYLQP